MFICFSVFAFRLIIVKDGTRDDFTKIDKLVVGLLGFLPTIGVLGYFLVQEFKKAGSSLKIAGKLILVAFAGSLLLNIFFTSKYILLNPVYTQRNNMIELGKIADGQYVLEPYEQGITLYNNIKPVVNEYPVLRKYLEENKNLYYYDYYDNYPGMRNFLDNTLFKGSEYTAVPVYRFRSQMQAFGQKRSTALYKVIKKSDAVAMYKKEYTQWKVEQKLLDETQKKYQQYEDGNYRNYPDIYGNYANDVDDDIYVNIHGDIFGDVNATIYGDVYGNIYGNVHKQIKGHVYGKIYGKIESNLEGVKPN